MDAVVERSNLMLAYQRVVANRGAVGVNGIGVTEFKDHLKLLVEAGSTDELRQAIDKNGFDLH